MKFNVFLCCHGYETGGKKNIRFEAWNVFLIINPLFIKIKGNIKFVSLYLLFQIFQENVEETFNW